MKLIIPGNPIPRKRPRFVRRGKFVGTYDEQHEIMLQFKLKVSELLGPNYKNDCLFKVHIDFFFEAKGKDKNKKLWGFLPYIYGNDLDNLEKWVLDSSNEILWKDDSQIVRLSSSKQYDENPRTEIIVMPVEEMKLSPKAQEILSVYSPHLLMEFRANLLDCARDTLIENDKDPLFLQMAANALGNFALKYTDYLKKLKKIAEK